MRKCRYRFNKCGIYLYEIDTTKDKLYSYHIYTLNESFNFKVEPPRMLTSLSRDMFYALFEDIQEERLKKLKNISDLDGNNNR
jgi:hypothetical protein